jgi:hypothetical protein
VKAGDLTALEEARTRAATGPQSARAAWSLVAWALAEVDAGARGAPPPPPPVTRPTLELVARLSDRPSADRDTTFLFRMARAVAPTTRPMLETFARTLPLGAETGLRSAMYLARDHSRHELREALGEAALGCKREELRGLAAAALWDSAGAPGTSVVNGKGDATARAKARDIGEDLAASRIVGNAAWGALLKAAAKGGTSFEPLVSETPFRWIQWGWLE